MNTPQIPLLAVKGYFHREGAKKSISKLCVLRVFAVDF